MRCNVVEQVPSIAVIVFISVLLATSPLSNRDSIAPGSPARVPRTCNFLHTNRVGRIGNSNGLFVGATQPVTLLFQRHHGKSCRDGLQFQGGSAGASPLPTASQRRHRMSAEDRFQRTILPIPDKQHVGRDHVRREGSGHEVPADRAAAAAEGRPQRPHRAARRRRLCRVERVRRADSYADRRAAGEERPQVQSLSHDGAVLADAAGAVDRPQSPLGQHGRHLRDRDRGARLLVGAAEEQGAARHDPQAQWLLDGAVRQVPRSAGLGDEPDGPVRPVADRRRRVRVLLRLHRRRDQPVVPGDLRRDDRQSSRRRRRRRAITSPKT